jgi:hypothetical protein
VAPGTGGKEGSREVDVSRERDAGDETEAPMLAMAFTCWFCIVEPPANRSLSKEGWEAPGRGIASGSGDGGAGHLPGRAAAISRRLIVRWWSAAREVLRGSGGCGLSGDMLRSDSWANCCEGFGLWPNDVGFWGGRGGEGVRRGDEMKSSKSSRGSLD